ncbi:hypothetical protein [Actinokineospora globicatena]|uniref:Uncharacterized protein n=1 Tax=Actinokineospora globicatena TaxID=103729 RepID=A0A9W6V6P8_9PSEU|nr:hypothetical protein [Actinokineospora globicatena]GLW91820.1 hypothetical protein Aglo03_26360 [Actinokineospora globicatena]
MNRIYTTPESTRTHLSALGARVSVVAFAPAQCEWCGMADQLATVRVYGDPAPAMGLGYEPISYVEVCADLCAEGVVRRALSELSACSRRGVVVEVAATRCAFCEQEGGHAPSCPVPHRRHLAVAR